MNKPELFTYIVTTSAAVFRITAEKIRIHQGVLIFTANDRHLASFKEWLNVVSVNHNIEDGYIVIKPLD